MRKRKRMVNKSIPSLTPLQIKRHAKCGLVRPSLVGILRMTSVESKAEPWKGTEELAQQGVSEGTVELLELLSHVQGGRMEEQRCLFDPKKIPCTPKHIDAANPALSPGTRSEVVSGSDRDGQEKTEAGNEMDHLCNMLSRVQGSRMDEQRCSAPQNLLAPGSPLPPRKANSRPASPTVTPSSLGPPRSSSLSPPPHKEREQRDGLQTAQQGVAPSTVEEEQFFSLLSHVQRGCMEEQRCVFDPNKRSTCTPKHTDATDTAHSAADIDQLFSILASSQGRRLDDQRASLNLLPGFQVVSGSGQDGEGRSVAGKEADQLCNMVSRVQGSRMDEQRCAAPQNLLAPGSPRKAHSRPASPTVTPSSLGPPRSSSLSPPPHKEREQRDGLQTAQQGVAPSTVEEEQFFSLLSHVQRGCMEEQRCVFDPNKRSTCTPKHTDATDTAHSAADIDQLFSILASSQGRRLDDQRASLNLLPGFQVVSGSGQDGEGRSVAGKEADQLCNMVSRVQGSRMDEQRCAAPQNLLAPGSPRKAHSRPASPTVTPSSLGPPRSSSLSPPPHKEREQRDGLQTAQGVAPSTVEEEQFFSLLSHVQRGCMEEQRCVFDPNKRSTCTPKHTDTTDTSAADIDQLFSILASSQGRRLDDQRASLNLLPGFQVVSGSGQDGEGRSVAGKEADQLCNMVSRVQGCRIDEQRCFLPVPLSPGLPRSVLHGRGCP
ncbi:hypothetical protein SKAU_G00294820 [Synaphobranchus kaupii]|uniref:Uncharacterized protein n=1 Tax=Synaphobranchus kaupii TaxID=118154 RepID=A0A9Q1EUJ7_SYNKA|nr:hypothetical protein SKAU_G00294820 [Synaphobranchus kaupii]